MNPLLLVPAAAVGLYFLLRKKAPAFTPAPAPFVAPSIPQAAADKAIVEEIFQGLKQGVVTTRDAAPGGDLFIRSAPSASAPVVGAADKDGVVTILDESDPVFSRVSWAGGRRPPAEGFARAEFIRIADAALLEAIAERAAARKEAAARVPTSTVAAAARSIGVSVEELEAAASTVNATAAQLLAGGATSDDLQALVDRMRSGSAPF